MLLLRSSEDLFSLSLANPNARITGYPTPKPCNTAHFLSDGLGQHFRGQVLSAAVKAVTPAKPSLNSSRLSTVPFYRPGIFKLTAASHAYYTKKVKVTYKAIMTTAKTALRTL
jgi:hypothetical protein